MKRTTVWILALVMFLPLACKTISDETKQEMAKPVDCSTAEQDVATLEAEKASVGKQVASGVRSVLPVAAVVGILSGDYKNRVQVATGKYNSDLEAKIAEIKATCGLP